MAQYWKRKARVDIVPLIDVMVMLVFFFLIYGTFDNGSASIPVTLPNSSTAPAGEFEQLVVALTAEGQYFIEGQPIAASQVSAWVTQSLVENPQLQVVLYPDREVVYEDLVAALDLIREGGAERPALGVRRVDLSVNENADQNVDQSPSDNGVID
ncbi:MAG: ExbD/TolR family protein [Bacillota bacterium]|jgi:biopolymer transport protein ExbD